MTGPGRNPLSKVGSLYWNGPTFDTKRPLDVKNPSQIHHVWSAHHAQPYRKIGLLLGLLLKYLTKLWCYTINTWSMFGIKIRSNVTTRAPSLINPSRDPILTHINSELTEVNTEFTRDNIHSYPSISQFAETHIQLYQFTIVQSYIKVNGLYTCTMSTTAFSNIMQGDNHSSLQH